MKSRKMEETPVVFEDVQIRQAVTAEEGQKVALAVLIAPDNHFCVSPTFLPVVELSQDWSLATICLLELNGERSDMSCAHSPMPGGSA